MRYIILFLFLSCHKELTPPATTMSIDNICYDGSNYKVGYTVQHLQTGDEIYGGCSKGTDTLSKIKLDGSGRFVVNTGAAGCTVKIFIGIVHTDLTKDYITMQGNCKECE